MSNKANTTNTIRAAMTRRLRGESSEPLCGIYVITHRVSRKCYVGQSIDIVRRWAEHRKGNGNSPKLSNALKKHGPDAFDFEIVELCAQEELNDRELFYISAYGFDSLSPKGYNIGTGGEGVTFTPEVRAKMSEAMLRLHASPEFQEKHAEANRRRAKDPEFRAKLSQSHKNSEKHREANRRRADPTIYTIINVKTGEQDTGTRLDFRDRHLMRVDMLSDLVNGKAKTHKGWRLAQPEEIQ